jgi:threonine dehydrogenase-like Zn-dependent dehydrogenase
MRSLVLTEIGRLAVQEVARPEPGPGEVLLRVTATGICGSDIHGYTGENGRRFPGQVMGHESAGHVAAVGEGVSFEPGLAVTFNPVVVPAEDAEAFAGREQHHPGKTVIGVARHVPAAFADYVVVPARNVVPLPEGMPVELGALIEPLAVAVHAVRRVQAAGLRRALVIGGGPIGQSVVIALKDAGVAEVVVSEPDAARRGLLESLGATALDPAAGDLTEQLEALGGAVDVTFDAVGITPTLRDALRATRLGGSVCLVGMGSPKVELDAFLVSTEERSLVGSFTYAAVDFEHATAVLGRDPEAYRPLISREVSPSEADAAFSALAAGDGTPGKVLVRFDLDTDPDTDPATTPDPSGEPR